MPLQLTPTSTLQNCSTSSDTCTLKRPEGRAPQPERSVFNPTRSAFRKPFELCTLKRHKCRAPMRRAATVAVRIRRDDRRCSMPNLAQLSLEILSPDSLPYNEWPASNASHREPAYRNNPPASTSRCAAKAGSTAARMLLSNRQLTSPTAHPIRQLPDERDSA